MADGMDNETRKATLGERLHNAVTASVSSVLGVFAPVAALRYAAGRDAMLSYAAATRKGPNGRWRPKDGKPDHLITRDRKLVQARARAMIKNNPNMGGAIEKIVDNVVFGGIWPQVQLYDATGTRDKATNSRIEGEFREWAVAVDWVEKQQLAVRHLWMDGAYIIHHVLDNDLLREGLVPYRPELLTYDAIDPGVHGRQPNGNIALWGQEFAPDGKRVGLHIRKQDPLSAVSFSAETVFIPSQWCTLVMPQRWIGQTQPISWMAAVLMTLHDFDEYLSSERIAARLAAAFGIFIKRPQTDLGGNALNGLPGGAVSGGAGTDGSPILAGKFIESGRMDELPPGADIAVAKSDRPGTTFGPYTSNALRMVSAGLRMSAEAFSNDYTESTYASARSGSLEERRSYRSQQFLLGARHNAPIWRKWCWVRATFGMGDEGRGKPIPMRDQLPGWQWVDPKNDAQAAEIRIKNVLDTRRGLCAESGLDFDDVVDGQHEEGTQIRGAGLNPEPWAGSGTSTGANDAAQDAGQ